MRRRTSELHETGPTPRGAGLAAALLLAVLGALAGCAAGEPPAEAGPRGGAGLPTTVPIGDLEWYVDYDAAVRVARRRDVPLWVHFGENPG